MLKETNDNLLRLRAAIETRKAARLPKKARTCLSSLTTQFCEAQACLLQSAHASMLAR